MRSRASIKHKIQQLYPEVVLGKVNQDVNEDQIIFLMNDKKHDVPFIELCELCNSHLHKIYTEERVSITHDVEYNDGCVSQLKCVKAFTVLAFCETKTMQIFCADGFGDVVKCYTSCYLCNEK